MEHVVSLVTDDMMCRLESQCLLVDLGDGGLRAPAVEHDLPGQCRGRLGPSVSPAGDRCDRCCSMQDTGRGGSTERDTARRSAL